MTLTVRYVDVNFVHSMWPSIKQFLESSLEEGMPYPEWSRSYNIDHVLQFLATGQWLLLVGLNENNEVLGAGTLAFANTPLNRVATITSTGGKFLANPDIIDQVKQIAKARGATVLQAYCRDSMVRLMQRSGFEPHNRLVEQQI
jgi:hypothetical protein